MANEAYGTQAIDRAAQLLVASSKRPAARRSASSPSVPACRRARPHGSSARSNARASSSASARAAASAPAPCSCASRAATPRRRSSSSPQPSLRRLADASGETINLAVPGPDGVEHLAQEDTAHFVGVTDWVGRRVPFELAANGKCFLAFGGGAADDVDLIRTRGYATSVDELEVGLSALAAPVLDTDGAAIAALSISGPTIRLTAERIDELAPLLEAARRCEPLHDDSEVPHDPRRDPPGPLRQHARRQRARGERPRRTRVSRTSSSPSRCSTTR